MSSQLWHADANLVRLQTARISAAVDLSLPAHGVHQLAIDGKSLSEVQLPEVQLLGVDLTLADRTGAQAAPDRFLRGGDLAVTYPDQPQTAARTEIYWRAASDTRAIASLQLLVSVQTNLLDSLPMLVARSRLAAVSVLRLEDAARGTFVGVAPGDRDDRSATAGGYLLRLPGTKLSYAQLVHPADSKATHISQANDASPCELSHALFAEHLEKGVILRARVLGVLLERAGDEDAAAQHFADFLAADLPLTT